MSFWIIYLIGCVVYVFMVGFMVAVMDEYSSDGFESLMVGILWPVTLPFLLGAVAKHFILKGNRTKEN